MVRVAAGMTQAALATRAGVSRSVVAAIESGRHVPSVDAAIRLARILDVPVERLFAPAPPLGSLGGPLGEGEVVVAARVGDQLVAAPVVGRGAAGSWSAPTGVVLGGAFEPFPGATGDGFLVLGCDPVLAIAGALLGNALVAVPSTTGGAMSTLAAGTCHAIVVHGSESAAEGDGLPTAPCPVARFHVARWRVGLGIAPGRPERVIEDVLGGSVPLVGRQAGAASQDALERAARRVGATVPEPVVRGSGHVEAARVAELLGGAAITYEPAAAMAGLRFLPLETHVVELWIDVRHRGHPGAAALAELLGGRRFRERAAAIGGYDLHDCGTGRAA